MLNWVIEVLFERDCGAANEVVRKSVFVEDGYLHIVVREVFYGEDVVPGGLFSSLLPDLGFVFGLPDLHCAIGILGEIFNTILENMSVSRVRRADIGFT